MAEVDWDHKTVIGSKGPKAKVTKNTSDLNGELDWPVLERSDS